MRRLSEKCITEASKSVHRVGLYLSFHLSWVLGPFFHEKLQNLKTSEDTFCHDITPLSESGHSQPKKDAQTNAQEIRVG